MAPQHDSTLTESDEKNLQFIVNGRKYRVDPKLPPSTTLLQFLREVASLKGTKGCCYEGGCGVCSVVASFVDRETGKERTCSVNACQVAVYSCAGWVIETIEHLGDRYRGYHSLQKALVGFYGTQCGFCSPGFVMTIYGELKSSGKLTAEKVEHTLDGNICRCTGYRPILDAFKSLAEDAPTGLSQKMVDIEDAYKSTCLKTGEVCTSKCSHDDRQEGGTCSSEIYSPKSLSPSSDIYLDIEGVKWYRPVTLNGVYRTLQKASPDESVRIMAGNTGQGVYKNDGPFDIYLDTNGIADLYAVAIGNPLIIGANVNLQRCIEVFKKMATDYIGYEDLNEIANHWNFIGNVNVRNVGSWSGNLMLKQKHPEFPSDVFVTLAALNATVKVGHSADSSTSDVSVEDLMTLDMSKAVILSMTIPPHEQNTVIRTYKITQRAVNSHAYVNCAFKFQLDSKDGFKVLSEPTLVYGGISSAFVHATETEKFLKGQRLSNESVIQEAVRHIAKEMKVDKNPLDASPAYRISLSQALFYKTVLSILGDVVSPEFRSGATHLERPLSSGKQAFDLNKDSWPVGRAIPKIESHIQVSGEAAYMDDMDPANGELQGAFVQSTVANAEIDIVDPSQALKVPGVVSFIDASDIPGTNSFFPSGAPDPVFISSKVQYAGQAIGLVVAKKQSIAKKAAKMVKVSYKNVKKPILTIKQALQAESTEPSEAFEGTFEGAFEGAAHTFEGAAHTLEGEFEQGSQFHFTMEPLAARVVPVEDGYDVFCTTQWPTKTQATVAELLKMKNNSINVSVRRLGGGYGGKISRGDLVACATAAAAHKLQKPVRVVLDLSTHMTLVGWRDPYMTNYRVGFENDGSLKKIEIRLISDAGIASNEATAHSAYQNVPNVYHCDSWAFASKVVNTNTAANTYCRTPGTPNAIASMENIIERVATFLKKDPVEIREKNFLNENSKTGGIFPRGENLVRTVIFPMLKKEAMYKERRAEVTNFNKTNRWKKRGISMVPLFYNLSYPKSFRYNTQVIIYAEDGTVVLAHGGIEMGQGLNTKIVQVAAKFLDVPLNYVKVKPTNVITGANSIVTGGSLGSDLVAHGIQKCCESLRNRMDVVAQEIEKRRKVKPNWLELVHACLASDVDLCERFWTGSNTHPGSYDIFAAVCTEVEIDVLTGQFVMLRADLIEDCGRSLSPYVDIGQIEGAFVMGVGFYTSELVKFDTKTGEKLTASTWDYKPPTALDIPVDLRITLLPKGDNQQGVLRSKATGEPALCLGYSVVTALRDAIKSAREDAGDSEWFEMSTPLTVEKIQLLCKVSANRFALKTKQTAIEEREDGFHLVEKRDILDVDEENFSSLNAM